jgi:hypothetical protein
MPESWQFIVCSGLYITDVINLPTRIFAGDSIQGNTGMFISPAIQPTPIFGAKTTGGPFLKFDSQTVPTGYASSGARK